MAAKGRIKPGETRNPGGMTREQRAARDLFNADLADPKRYRKFLASYDEQLEAGNPAILKDYADRIGGKVKELVELSGDPDAPVNPLHGLTVEELKTLVRAQHEKEATGTHVDE